jgi:cytochrome c peroxidase
MNNLDGSKLIVNKLHAGHFEPLFKRVFGLDVFKEAPDEVFRLMGRAIAAYESSPEVSPFTSKYDAWLEDKAKLSASELDGLRLVTGSMTGRPGGPPYYKNAECVDCHAIPSDPRDGPDLWTSSCYANLGAPRNPSSPAYVVPGVQSGVDLGLGDYLYPLKGLPPGDFAEHDPLAVDGTFRAPSLRNVDKRPYPGFVKAYFHNGVFKSLKQVVHFYNTRNLTTMPGEVIDFTKTRPYAGLRGKPLWPPPEYPSPTTLQNPAGMPNSSKAQIGRLGLTDKEENDIVAFLKTLSDGYFARNRASARR